MTFTKVLIIYLKFIPSLPDQLLSSFRGTCPVTYTMFQPKLVFLLLLGHFKTWSS
jgi:hypothetical protein